jgi:hypothetical protein
LSELSDKNGIVYIPIPSPNGGTLMIPTEIPTVSDNQSDVILHAMELFLSPGDPRAEFQEGDVFDLTSAEGVFDLISGITHIVSDSAASFEERVNAPGGNAKAVYLSLDKKTGIISIAKQDKQVIQIQSVADLQANKDLLKQLLMEKLFSVKLSMVNKSDATYEAVYNPETQSIDTVPHNNYNEYVKQHLKVDIIGTPIGNGEYSYFDQPVIQFATDFLREEKPVESKPEEIKEDEFVNLIDKLESLVEKFKAEGQTEEEAKISAFNELNETEKTELLATQPVQQPSIENRSRKDLFPDTSEFGQAVGDSESVLENEIKKARLIEKNEQKAQELEVELKARQAKISSYSETNGIGVAEYTNPTNGLVDVIMSGTSDNDYVGYVRVYENGKPTERWTSKMSNKSGNKANFKTMISQVQSKLPEGHEYTESTSISLDGLRVYANQLNRVYEILLDIIVYTFFDKICVIVSIFVLLYSV